MKIIGFATADWHVPEDSAGRSWKTLPGAAGDVLYALQQTVALCVQHRVPLFAAGDNFDGPDPEPPAVAALYETLRPLAEIGESLYYVLGNHDRGRDWLAPLGGLAVCLDKTVATLRDGTTITGLSYRPSAQFAAEVTQVAPTTIGLYHQTWSELSGVGRDRVSFETLPRHQLAICGDIHTRSRLAPASGPRGALSPGPLVPQSITEFAQLGASLVFAVHDDMSTTGYPLRSRPIRVVDAADAQTAVEAIHAVSAVPATDLPSSLAQPVLVVRMRENQPELEATLAAAAQRSGCLLRLYHPTARPTDPATRSAPSASLDAAIAAWPAADDVRLLAQRLVTAGADPVQILRIERAQYETYLEPEDVDETGPY